MGLIKTYTVDPGYFKKKLLFGRTGVGLIASNNNQSIRAVYKLDDRYRKIWYGEHPEQWLKTNCLEYHITILETFMPGFVLDYGMINNEKMFIDYKIILGKSIWDFHPKEINLDFTNKIKKFCIKNLMTTWPYAHRGWYLENILIYNDNINLIDWDNVRRYDNERTLDGMINRCSNQLDNEIKRVFLMKKNYYHLRRSGFDCNQDSESRTISSYRVTT